MSNQGGLKHDQGKPPMSLLPHDALVEIAKVLGFGAIKYSPGNWAKGISHTKLLDSIFRHAGAINNGEDIDAESGLPHAAHLGAEALFLIYMQKHRPDLDDRWIKVIEMPKPSAPSFELEVGKRYRRRDGKLTRALMLNPSAVSKKKYPFQDPLTELTYRENGRFYDLAPSDYDLVEEVK